MLKNRRLLSRLTALVLLAVVLAGMAAWSGKLRYKPQIADAADQPGHDQAATKNLQQQLGLISSLPIYWQEAASLELRFQGRQTKHWVRSALEQNYKLIPLDRLSDQQGEGNPDALFAGLDYLLLAQPRAMPPADMVALDQWVRDGGQVLVFVDPMLTQDSDYALGDPRRPQAVATLDPVLARWGLTLSFDDNQDEAARSVVLGQDQYGMMVEMPVRLSGTLSVLNRDDETRPPCRTMYRGLMAQCRIGSGQAFIIADAALLERPVKLEGPAKTEKQPSAEQKTDHHSRDGDNATKHGAQSLPMRQAALQALLDLALAPENHNMHTDELVLP